MHTPLARLRRLAGRQPLRLCFAPSPETAPLGYFPPDMAADAPVLAGLGVDWAEEPATADLILTTAHGVLDLRPWIDALRAQAPDAPVALWSWDNHWSPQQNRAAAAAADIAFAAHAYCAGSLLNPDSILAGATPLCCGQWTAAELSRRRFDDRAAPRVNKVLAAYVDHGSVERRAWLQLMTEFPELEVRLTAAEDRGRYFGLSRDARWAEWRGFTASVVLPVDRDLSTRLFDGLAAGHVVVAAWEIDDLDKVISPADQRALPLFRFSMKDPASLRAACAAALDAFAAEGEAGALRRSLYCESRHMLPQRLAQIAGIAQAVGDGRLVPRPLGEGWGLGRPIGASTRKNIK